MREAPPLEKPGLMDFAKSSLDSSDVRMASAFLIPSSSALRREERVDQSEVLAVQDFFVASKS